MDFHAMIAWCILAGLIPFVAVTVTAIYFCLWRFRVWFNNRSGRNRSMVYSCCLAMGMAFLQVMRLFYQPSFAYVLKAKQDEDADEDDEGDPENLKKQLNRQYKRIRRGEPVDRLVLRL